MDNNKYKEKTKLYEVITVHGFRLRVKASDEKSIHEIVTRNGVLYESIKEIKPK